MTDTKHLKQSGAPSKGVPQPLIVCVDDEPPILAALERLLRREPYEVRTTPDPEEALLWVRTEEVAVLIADYRMPAMSGTTLLQLAKASSPRTGRILLTGYPGESMVIAAGDMGLLDLVGKPWDDEALKRLIQARLGNTVPTSDHSNPADGRVGPDFGSPE